MSILNVDQISPIGSGSTITVTATETKTGNITIGTGSSIFSPAGNTLVLGTNNLERIRIKNDGKVGIGTNNPTAKLEIKGSDNPLVKIVQDTSGIARLNLESATNDGYQYSGIGLGDGTNDAELMWTTGGFDINVGNAVRLRINSSGAWGAGTNFGSSGQVLTSQGSGSAPTWATASSGKILQITEGIYNVQTTIQGATSVTGLAGTITPTAAGSKILVISNQQGQIRVDSDPSQVINFYLDRDVNSGGFNNIQFQMYLGGAFPNNRRSDRMTTITQLDTPSYSLGQSISYRMRAGTYTSNYGLRYIAQHQGANSPSRMTLLEVAQ